jgi:hypothetical protein
MLRLTRRSAAALASCAVALAMVSPATAHTYRVVGKQVAVDVDSGAYEMRGGLVGSWAITSFEELATSPLYHATGTERFTGCIDRRRDRSCKGDPSGTLSFDFQYWAEFSSPDPASLVWGACWHPIVSGTGDFAGAHGAVYMVDTPTSRGVKTTYVGTIALRGHRTHGGARAATRTRSTCGSAR